MNPVIVARIYGRDVSEIVARGTKDLDPTQAYCWLVYGEDPNADFAGHHYDPLLAYVRGTLPAVAVWAVQQKGWLTWGAGGYLAALADPIDLTGEV